MLFSALPSPVYGNNSKARILAFQLLVACEVHLVVRDLLLPPDVAESLESLRLAIAFSI